MLPRMLLTVRWHRRIFVPGEVPQAIRQAEAYTLKRLEVRLQSQRLLYCTEMVASVSAWSQFSCHHGRKLLEQFSLGRGPGADPDCCTRIVRVINNGRVRSATAKRQACTTSPGSMLHFSRRRKTMAIMCMNLAPVHRRTGSC